MTVLFTRLNITAPSDLISELRRVVPERMRSKIVSEALEEKLTKIKREKAIEELAGIWKKAGGIPFRNDKELSLWRKKLWSSFDKRLAKE